MGQGFINEHRAPCSRPSHWRSVAKTEGLPVQAGSLPVASHTVPSFPVLRLLLLPTHVESQINQSPLC